MISPVAWGLAALAFGVSAVVTGAQRRYALRTNLVDRPNARSSHTIPTPRGGGLAIVIAFLIGLAGLAAFQDLPLTITLALAGGGLAVAVVGFVDDRRALSPRIRLLVHFAAAFWALVCLGGVPPVRIGEHIVSLGWWGYLLGGLGVVWTLNLFNFMDGIDGIAASEAVFFSVGASVAALFAGASSAIPELSAVFGAACGGFLLWNWPPAKIFMGDVGSGFIGYVIAVLALVGTAENPAAWTVWLTLGGVFFVDATVTLVRRVACGERLYEAHRTHAYQWLSRRWASHARVTWLVLAINVLWLLPCGILAVIYPRYGSWIILFALFPLLVGTIMAGAGRREVS